MVPRNVARQEGAQHFLLLTALEDIAAAEDCPPPSARMDRNMGRDESNARR